MKRTQVPETMTVHPVDSCVSHVIERVSHTSISESLERTGISVDEASSMTVVDSVTPTGRSFTEVMVIVPVAYGE